MEPAETFSDDTLKHGHVSQKFHISIFSFCFIIHIKYPSSATIFLHVESRKQGIMEYKQKLKKKG